MGLVSILAAALAGYGLGALWYMALARRWVAASGVATDREGRPRNFRDPRPYLISALAMLSMSGLLAHVFAASGIASPRAGLTAGLGIGALAVLPWLAMNYAYAGRPWRLVAIDGGYAVLGPGVIGLGLTLL